MTPKEKAKELFINYCSLISGLNRQYIISNWEHLIKNTADDYFIRAKQCALIAVNELLNSFDSFMDSRKHFRHELEIQAEKYWEQVKQEIEKLV